MHERADLSSCPRCARRPRRDAAGLEAGGEPGLAAEVLRAAGDYDAAERDWGERDGDLIAAFRALARVELWTCAATHALFPLVATDRGLRIQDAKVTASHLHRFGHWSGRVLAAGVRVRAGTRARARGRRGVPRNSASTRPGWRASTSSCPWATEPGPVAVPIDWETVQLVWNDEDGYPAS